MFNRLFDIIFSLSVILILSPLFLAIAIIIKLTSKGPVLYKSPRLKANFQIFTCLKFRTMYLNADEELERVFDKNPTAYKQWLSYRKIKNDPRVTPFGKFLRKFSLDELPQFFNALKGDISVVGPRPFMLNEMKSLGDKAPKLLSIKPGITGIWGVSGRNKLSFDERIALEERYIEKKSFFLDFLIICKTIPQFFFPNGAF